MRRGITRTSGPPLLIIWFLRKIQVRESNLNVLRQRRSKRWHPDKLFTWGYSVKGKEEETIRVFLDFFMRSQATDIGKIKSQNRG